MSYIVILMSFQTISSINYDETVKKNVETFTWMDSEVELLLEAVKVYASECHYYKGIDKTRNTCMQ